MAGKDEGRVGQQQRQGLPVVQGREATADVGAAPQERWQAARAAQGGRRGAARGMGRGLSAVRGEGRAMLRQIQGALRAALPPAHGAAAGAHHSAEAARCTEEDADGGGSRHRRLAGGGAQGAPGRPPGAVGGAAQRGGAGREMAVSAGASNGDADTEGGRRRSAGAAPPPAHIGHADGVSAVGGMQAPRHAGVAGGLGHQGPGGLPPWRTGDGRGLRDRPQVRGRAAARRAAVRNSAGRREVLRQAPSADPHAARRGGGAAREDPGTSGGDVRATTPPLPGGAGAGNGVAGNERHPAGVPRQRGAGQPPGVRVVPGSGGGDARPAWGKGGDRLRIRGRSERHHSESERVEAGDGDHGGLRPSHGAEAPPRQDGGRGHAGAHGAGGADAAGQADATGGGGDLPRDEARLPQRSQAAHPSSQGAGGDGGSEASGGATAPESSQSTYSGDAGDPEGAARN